MAYKLKRKNYLNNKDMLKEVIASQAIQKANPDWTPAQSMTPTLVDMIIKLVDRYGEKHNWAGYTYNDEMRAEARIDLLKNALKFKTEKSDNPFAYFTMIAHHAFLHVLSKEKKQRTIIEEKMLFSGMHETWNKQAEEDMKKHGNDES